MRSRFVKIRLSLFGFMRAAFAAFLLLALLSEMLLAGVFSASVSNLMPCCTGNSSHASTNACADGVCHVKSNNRKKRLVVALPNEPICGSKRPKIELHKSTSEFFQKFLSINTQYQLDAATFDSSLLEHQQSFESSPRISHPAFTHPCKSECSSGACCRTSQNGKSNKAIIAHAQRPRPPTVAKNLSTKNPPAYKTNDTTLLIKPRAPPVFS